MLILSVKCVPMITLHFNEVLFYILAMNCIKFIFGYLYFSPKAFLKYEYN